MSEPTRTELEPTLTATDTLRRLLDERGVEWWEDAFASKHRTVFDGKDGVRYCVYQLGSSPFISSTLPVTPEQAIAATLGVEPDEAAMVKLHDRMNAALLEYERAQGIEKRDGDGGVVVPFVAEMHSLLEEAATLDSCNCTNSERTSDELGREPWVSPTWERWHKRLRHDEIKSIGDAVEQLMYEAIEFGGDMGPNGNTYNGIDEGDVLMSGFINEWVARFESMLGPEVTE